MDVGLSPAVAATRLASLRSRVEEQNILLEHYKDEAKQTKEKLEEAHDKLAEQEKILKTRSDADKLAVILRVEKENIVFQKKQQDLQAGKVNNTAEMDKKLLSLKAEKTKLAGENQKLKKKVADLENQVTNLEQKLEDVEEQAADEDEYGERIEELENEIEAYKDQCNEYEKQLKENEKTKKNAGNQEKDFIGFKERAIRAEKAIVQLVINERKTALDAVVEEINMTIADLESKIPLCESRGRPDMAGAFKTYCAEYRSIRNQVSGSYREIQRMGENMQTQIDQGKCLRELKPLPQLNVPAPPNKEAWTFQPKFNDFVLPGLAQSDLTVPNPPNQYAQPPPTFVHPNMRYAPPNHFAQPMQPRQTVVLEQVHEERMALLAKHQQEMIQREREAENRSNSSDQSNTSTQPIQPNPNQVKLLKDLVAQVNTNMSKYMIENNIMDDSRLRYQCAERVCDSAIRMAPEHETPTIDDGVLMWAMTMYAQSMETEHGIIVQIPLCPKNVPNQASASATHNQMTQAQASVDTSVLLARKLRADGRIRTPRDQKTVKPPASDTQDTGVVFPETVDPKDLETGAECTICLDPLHPHSEPCRCPQCNYQYHYACLEKHLNERNTNGKCPTCQQRMISGRQFPPLG